LHSGQKTDHELDALMPVSKPKRSNRASAVVRCGRPGADGSPVQSSETFQGIQVAQDVFNGRCAAPDGIVITNGLMAQGGLMTLSRLGVVMNKDVLVATHANRGSAVLRSYENEIIRMEYDPAEIVQVLFDRLEAQMAGVVRNAVDCLESGAEPETSYQKALRASEIIFAFYESVRRRARVELPLTEVLDNPLHSLLGADGM
jgi:hypothetical protein